MSNSDIWCHFIKLGKNGGTWWKGNFGAVAPELTKVAVRVLSIPTSSAAAERNWSTFSYIHDKKQNKLSNDHVFKLVYIYFNNKLKN